MSDEIKNTEITQPDTKGDNETPADTSGKMFTQEEVNNIIRARLEKMKTQAQKEVSSTLEQREQEILARENKLMVKEKLDERKMPLELANIITCESEEDLNKKLDTLQKIYGDNAKKDPQERRAPLTGFRMIGAPPADDGEHRATDVIRKAMGMVERND